MKNKLTAVIITGTPQEISSIINASFANSTTLDSILELPQIAKVFNKPKIKYKYYRPTYSSSFSLLTKKQAKVVKKYLSNHVSFNFKDLRTYVNSNLTANKVTNASLSTFLNSQNYKRYQCVTQDSKTYYSWEKNDA